MVLDCAEYAGMCTCGREHPLVTKKVVVEYGAINDFDKYMDECGLSGRRTVIYDSNTYNLPGIIHIPATKEIILPAQGLHSEKSLIESIITELDDPDVLVAVGSGTIMDFARYNAYKLGLPFAAIPTLASSDGFTANICSVIIDGQKKSIPMNAPVLVVADLDIISAAPMFLTVSGVGDILSKYISLADWEIAHIVSGEYFCGRVASMADEALTLMSHCAYKMGRGEAPDYEAMTMAQMISGLTMQMLSNSRAASGAEHLIAHLVEMKPPRFEGAHGIHGECVGVGTILCAEEYHKLAQSVPKAKRFEPLDQAWVREKFGELADGIIEENKNDVLATFNPGNIVNCWDEVVNIINTIPTAEALTELFAAIGAKYTLEDIGIDPALKPEILEISAAIRNRLTLARMRRVLDFESNALTICVFGASSAALGQIYYDEAFSMGAELARRGHAMVFGGGTSGLMGAAARGVSSEKGRMIGVAPKFFDEPGILHAECSEMFLTETMGERKKMMEDMADAFIILPGGIGTLEEFFEVLTLKQLGRHSKAMAVLDTNGYYEELDAMMLRSVKERFTPADGYGLYKTFRTPAEVMDYIESYKAEPEDIWKTKIFGKYKA